MSCIVQVADLSKVYRIFASPWDFVQEVLLGHPALDSIQALEGISFEIEAGESFGLVGDNGAGKSTLLKILTGTTLPTSGQIDVQGSVSALLELGAGFHPEFTGLQNIRFSGALMGFSQEEVEARLPEIVEFSGLDSFIEHPVRTYSSGMYVRLGFAVATGFDPEVLIIDEALAVGDQAFQKKCTDRILEFRRRGKTIIFCSHNLYQVKSLCERTLWLEQGRMRALGESPGVVDAYTDLLREESPNGSAGTFASHWKQSGSRSELSRIEQVRLLDSSGCEANSFQVGESILLEVWAKFSSSFPDAPGVAVAIVRNDGVVVYAVSNTLEDVPLHRMKEGLFYGRLLFPEIQLLSGRYYFNVCTTDQDNLQCYDIVERAVSFTISSSDRDTGLVRLHHRWSH